MPSQGFIFRAKKQWKQAGNSERALKRLKITPKQKSDIKRIKALERELRRKEKALAVTTALLVLGKKFDAYWKEKEDLAVIDICNAEEFASLPPSQIVPILADRGEYIDSKLGYQKYADNADRLTLLPVYDRRYLQP